jgi:hypothetical protein
VGWGWYPKKRPLRLRATYTRTAGVRQMFGALDLATGQMIWRTRQRKRWIEFLDLLKVLRARFDGRLYVIVDNFAPTGVARCASGATRRRRAGVPAHPRCG